MLHSGVKYWSTFPSRLNGKYWQQLYVQVTLYSTKRFVHGQYLSRRSSTNTFCTQRKCLAPCVVLKRIKRLTFLRVFPYCYLLNHFLSSIHILNFSSRYLLPTFLERQKRGFGWRLRCLPYFVMAGVAKSGTTDIFHSLSLHPDIIRGATKEPLYWNKIRYNGRLITPNTQRAVCNK